MKIILSALICCSVYSLNGQISAESAVENVPDNVVVRQGQLYQEVFYGFPNFYRGFDNGVRNVDGLGNTTLTKSRGLGPIGTRVEYMMNDDFSIGFETVTLIGENEYLYLSPDGDTLDRFYRKRTKIGVLPLFTFHFSKIPKFDMYWCAGLGYKFFKYESSGNENIIDFTRISLPVSWRFAVGFRFLPIPRLGIGMNVGIGQGGIINFGAVYKLF